MDEYIRREDVIEWFMPYAHIGESIDADVVISDIKGMKAADVAPVVHCKSCVRYDMGVCLKIYSDGNVHTEAWQERKPDDFCSYGERRDDA